MDCYARWRWIYSMQDKGWSPPGINPCPPGANAMSDRRLNLNLLTHALGV